MVYFDEPLEKKLNNSGVSKNTTVLSMNYNVARAKQFSDKMVV